MYQQITLGWELGPRSGDAVHGKRRTCHKLQCSNYPDMDWSRRTTSREDSMVSGSRLEATGRNL